MKKRFFKLLFVMGLMFGFTFTLASCNKNETTPDSGKVEPTPDPTPTPEPVSKTLTELPEGFYASLAPASNSIVINFNNFKATGKNDVEYEIDNDSYIRIGYVNDTLKANGIFKASFVAGKEINSFYLSFSLDDAFKAKIVGEVEPNLDYVAKTEEETVTGSRGVNYIYEEIELSKEKIIEFINAQLENADIDLDLNNVDSLDDITSVFGVSDELVESEMELVNTMFDSLMGLFFNETFAENRVTLEFTLDSLTLINLALSNATIETLADAVLGEGFFDKILSYLEDYSMVDQTKVLAPMEGMQYFTYNAETKQYEMCESLTSWAPNTVYYVDNKDLGSYTLADLIKTSDTDETGFVTVDSIDNGINKLFELIGKVMPMIQGAMGQGQSETDDDATSMPTSGLGNMFDQTFIVKMLSMLFGITEPYYLVEPVTGLTEWEGHIEGMFGFGTSYYTLNYEEATDLSEFSPYTLYFIKNDNDEYVLIDTKDQTPGNQTYYTVDIEDVEYKKIKTPDATKTYYVAGEERKFEEEYILVEWDSNRDYYTEKYNEVNVTEWDPNTKYFYLDRIFGRYCDVLQDETPTPDPDETYYTREYVKVDKTAVTSPQEGVQYFVYIDDPEFYTGYANVQTEFEKDVEYYVKDASGKYVLTADEKPVANVQYYTQKTVTIYTACENLVKFDETVRYYLDAEGSELVDIYEATTPDATKTYYKTISTIGKFLAIEPMQKLSVNDIITKLYPIVSPMVTSVLKIEMPKLDAEGFKLDQFLAPVVEIIKEIKDTKIYTFAAKGIDSINPLYDEAHVKAWDPDTDYYTKENNSYSIVDKNEVTTPVANVTYYTRYSRTVDDVKNMIDELIASFDENITLKVITDNEAKIQKVEFELGFDKISGGFTVDFTQEYKDDVKETLAYAKLYEHTYFENSTEAMENLLNENAFKDYVDYEGASFSLIKQNGEYIGFNRTLNGQTNSYFFGVNNEALNGYSSESDYFCDKYIEISVMCYDKANNDFEKFIFVYNVETQKFEYAANMRKIEITYFDYEQNEWLSIYKEVDTTKTPDPKAEYYTYEDGEYKVCGTLTAFESNVKYYIDYTDVAEGDEEHPLKIKFENKFTGDASYNVTFFPATQTN